MNGVVRPLLIGLVIYSLLATASSPSASAQNKNALPEVFFMISGADELKSDLKYMVGLGDAREQKQWVTIEETLDTFLPGLDTTKPIRIDPLINNKKLTYRSHFPVANANDLNKQFIGQNLVGFGMKAQRRGRNYWSLGGGGFTGFMRYGNNYASIAELADDLPADLPDPAVDMLPLLEKKFDLAVSVKNTKSAPDDLKDRATALEDLRKELDALLKPLEGEADDEFSLRKLISQQQFDEVKRFVVEAEALTVGWTTDIQEGVGRVDFDMTALEGTDLEKSIMQLAEAPGMFQGMTKSEKAIISLKLNFPFDEMRKKNLTDFLDQALPVVASRIAALEGFTEEEKAAGQKALELYIKLLKDGTAMGIIDSYGEITIQEDSKHGLLGGIRVPENGAETIRELLKIVPELKAGNTVEFDVETVGDVALHKVHIGSGGMGLFEKWLGTEVDLWVGTSPKTAWISEGENSLETLKAAIEKVSTPSTETSPVVVDFFLRVQPWIKLNSEKTKEAKQPKLRELIESAFVAGEDEVTFTLSRIENRTEGRYKSQKGFLRLFGKAAAKFSEETLQ